MDSHTPEEIAEMAAHENDVRARGAAIRKADNNPYAPLGRPPAADDCVIDTCRFFTGSAAEGNVEWGYKVCCVATYEHDCPTEDRVLIMDRDAKKTGPVDRCYAVAGTAWTGPLYCGNPAKTLDANGRPVCGVHKKGNPGIMWYGDRYRYPEGTGGHWKFNKGEARGDQ